MGKVKYSFSQKLFFKLIERSRMLQMFEFEWSDNWNIVNMNWLMSFE